MLLFQGLFEKELIKELSGNSITGKEMTEEEQDLEEVERLTNSTEEELQRILEETREMGSNAEDEYNKLNRMVERIEQALELADELGDLEKIEEDVIRQRNKGRTKTQANQTLQQRYSKSLDEISTRILKIKTITNEIKQLYKELHPEVEENEEILEHMKDQDLDIAQKIQNVESLEQEVVELENYRDNGERSIDV